MTGDILVSTFPSISVSILNEANHQLESRMREIRTSGSEGGGAEINRLFLPLYFSCGVQPTVVNETDTRRVSDT